jgi:hypothetical protein
MKSILLLCATIVGVGVVGFSWFANSVNGSMQNDILVVAQLHKENPNNTLPLIKKHVDGCVVDYLAEDAAPELSAMAVDATFKIITARSKVGANATRDELFDQMLVDGMNEENIDSETVDLMMTPQLAFNQKFQKQLQHYLFAENAIIGCVVGKIAAPPTS